MNKSGITENAQIAEFVYRPDKKEKIWSDELGRLFLNIYEPPKHFKHNYYFEKEIEEVTSLPESVEKFLRFMCGQDEQCYKFLLHWIANSLKFTPQTTLIVITWMRGVGKTLLATFIAKLHGEHNFVKTKDNVFKSRFNPQFRNKTLALVDELSLNKGKSGEHEMNNIKDMMNKFIEVERKGIDAESVRNFISLIITSNNYDAIPHIGKDTRQFSIMETPEVKFKEEFPELDSKEKIHEALLKDDIINESFKFFYHYDSGINPFHAYRGKKAEELIESSMPHWKDVMVNEVYFDYFNSKTGGFSVTDNNQISIKDIKKELELFKGVKNLPGRSLLERLCNEYPTRFRLVQKGKKYKGERFIQFIWDSSLNDEPTSKVDEASNDGDVHFF